MNGGTLKTKVHFGRGRNGAKQLQSGVEAPPSPARLPRVAKLMALAIRFDGLIHDGLVADQADLARLGHVSRARITQIMNLLNLAPEIQQELLFLPPVEQGRDPVTEQELRAIVAEVDWRAQRRMWLEITGGLWCHPKGGL